MTHRYVRTDFWEDDKVQSNATPEDKYFMLYLLTNPHTNQLGCYKVSKRLMSYETGYNLDTIDKLLNRMRQLNFAEYDDTTTEILILNWYKYNWTRSETIKTYIIKNFEDVKSEILRKKINDMIRYIYGIDTSFNLIYFNNNKYNTTNNNINNNSNNIYSKFEEKFGRTISPLEYETIAKMVSEYSLEFVEKALSEAVSRKAYSLVYINKILNNWKKENLKTIEEVDEYIKKFNSKKQNNDDELDFLT